MPVMKPSSGIAMSHVRTSRVIGNLPSVEHLTPLFMKARNGKVNSTEMDEVGDREDA
jgi:hypothetical protein